MNVDIIYTLEDRGILFINGEESKAFLQNIISNNIEKVKENNSIFSTLLTPQGKYLFDFLIIKHKKGFFIDCEKKQINDLFKRLNLYKLRSRVEILDLSNEFVVAAISKEKFLEFTGSKNKNGFTIKFREDPILLDPRNINLGARLVINLEKLYLSMKKLNLKPEKPDEYYKLSHKLGIPQKDCDKLQDKIFGIECNFEELNGIDFKKGCYRGQENTARIKLKNKLSKRLMALNIIEGEIKEDQSIFLENENMGRILIANEYPFGIFKINNKKIDFNKIYYSDNAKIKIVKPEWVN